MTQLKSYKIINKNGTIKNEGYIININEGTITNENEGQTLIL